MKYIDTLHYICPIYINLAMSVLLYTDCG